MKGHDKVNQKIVSTIWRSLGSFERCGSPNRKRKFLHPTASAVALFCRLNSEKNHPFSKKPPEDTNTAPLCEGDFFLSSKEKETSMDGRVCCRNWQIAQKSQQVCS